MSETISSGPVRDKGLNGYWLAFDDGVNVNVCAVALDEAGDLTAHMSTVQSLEPKAIVEALASGDWNPRAEADWVYSMLGDGRVTPLADVLGLPHAGRDTHLEGLAEMTDRLSGENLAGLDAEAVTALSSAPVKRVGTYSFYRGDAERAVRRRQAARSYPLLADFMTAGLSTKMAVDRSQPLADPLATALSGFVDGAVGRSVVKKIALADPIPEGCRLETVVKFMTLVPVDWIPTKGADWTAFCNVAEALLEDLSMQDSAIPDLIKGCGGKWSDFSQRIARKAGVDDPEEASASRRVMSAAAEMTRAFVTVGILPLAAHASPVETVSVTPELMHRSAAASRDMLLSGRNAGDVADLQRRWHQERASILGAAKAIQEERDEVIRGNIDVDGWPGLTQPVQAPNGLWLVPLTNPGELLDEGGSTLDRNGVRGLSHCVGGYDTSARNCTCHIVSVRKIDHDGTYARVSTVEFAGVSAENDRLKVMQNKGSGNGKPSEESKDAVQWYVASVARGTVPVNRAQINAFLASGLIPEDGVERVCGYDWRERDMINAAVAPWGRFVGPAYRGMNLDEIMASPEVSSITELVPPEILLAPGR